MGEGNWCWDQENFKARFLDQGFRLEALNPCYTLKSPRELLNTYSVPDNPIQKKGNM